MSKSKIILLYGVSSAGKSTLARELQAVLPEPYLHVCIDAFEQMMPRQARAGGKFDETAVFSKLLTGMHGSISTLANAGNNLIVDHILIEGDVPANWISECMAALAPFEHLIVKVSCPLPELKRREQQRGDRKPGLAEWQTSRLPKTIFNDIEVDTSVESPELAAQRIVDYLRSKKPGVQPDRV